MHAAFDTVQDHEVQRLFGVRQQFRHGLAQGALGVGFERFLLTPGLVDQRLNFVPVFLHAVGRQADRQVRHESFFHEVEKLVAGPLHHLLGLHLLDQLALAFIQFGDHIAKIADNAFGVFECVEKVVDFAVVEKGLQGIARVAGIAMASAKTPRRRFDKGLGKQAAVAGEGVGALQRRLVDQALQPAVFQQQVQNPAGLLPLAFDRRGVFVLRIAVQHRGADDGLLKDIDDLLAIIRAAVIRH